MKIAVLTCTRDRLAYTKHCFATLEQFAGCDYDHYVFDNGSEDGTAEWLFDEWLPGPGRRFVERCFENAGLGVGFNRLLREADPGNYDVVVTFDNDCELTQPNTLRDVARLSLEGGCILGPRILGLVNPPKARRKLRIGDDTILDIQQIGGIFLAAPAWVYDDFRYRESGPWVGEDAQICGWFRAQGGTVGYVDRLEAWHYEGTLGQRDRYPEYFERADAEFNDRLATYA